LTENC